jgi:CRP/FNR family transcriptional regulator, nitrogen fixation regulation protein
MFAASSQMVPAARTSNFITEGLKRHELFASCRAAAAELAPREAVEQPFGPLMASALFLELPQESEILAQGEESKYCFIVRQGCVRTVRRFEDGRRQIGEFLLPGDIFGWETLGEQEFAAEAATPVTLWRLRLSDVEARADEDRAFAQRLRRHAAEKMRAVRSRLVVLGRLTAQERIASFLLEMRERLATAAQATIDLPMCRTDMADYLGLTIETVSRGLTVLRRHGAITVQGTRIGIHNHAALRLAGAEWIH